MGQSVRPVWKSVPDFGDLFGRAGIGVLAGWASEGTHSPAEEARSKSREGGAFGDRQTNVGHDKSCYAVADCCQALTQFILAPLHVEQRDALHADVLPVQVRHIAALSVDADVFVDKGTKVHPRRRGDERDDRVR
jgi:hypothetical protein